MERLPFNLKVAAVALAMSASASTTATAELSTAKVKSKDFKIMEVAETNTMNGNLRFVPIKQEDVPIMDHPLAYLSGKYEHEPLWDDYMLAIEDYRRKMNEQEDTME